MINTYGELKTDIADWLDREDLADSIPTFIKLAESKIYRALRTRDTEFTKTWTEADEPLSPIELPDNFREAHLLTLDGLPIKNISSQEFRERQWAGQEPTTQYFTIIERKLYLLAWPTEAPDSWTPFNLELIYYGTESLGEMATWDTPTNPNQVPESDGTPPETAVRDDTATSRLLQVAPDLYLYGALVEAYRYLREPDKMMEYRALFAETINNLEIEAAMADLTGGTVSVSSIYYDGRP
jgi:hypothetical protein